MAGDGIGVRKGPFLIRPYEPRDRADVLRVMGGKPPHLLWTDPESPSCLHPLVAELDGRFMALGTAELRPECQLLLDPTVGTPRQGWEAIGHVLDASSVIAWSLGHPVMLVPVVSDFARFAQNLSGVKGASLDSRTHVLVDVHERLRRD